MSLSRNRTPAGRPEIQVATTLPGASAFFPYSPRISTMTSLYETAGR